MSRAYDAKQAVLKAYPNDPEAAVDLFLGYLDMSRKDAEYEWGVTIEEYLGFPPKENG